MLLMGSLGVREASACPPGFMSVTNACVTPGKMEFKDTDGIYTIAEFQSDCQDVSKFNGDHASPTDSLACVAKDGTVGCEKGESCWECCVPDGL